ncbi:MAG: SCP2 domain-containing protein [Bdellovibrio bacteriovorus]
MSPEAHPDLAPDPGSERAAPRGLSLPTPVLAALEGALNGYLALDPEGARGFVPLHGRIIAIEISGLGVRLTLIPGPDRVQVFGAYDAAPDCLIRGAPLALLRLVTAERKEGEIGPGGVQIEGDSTIAHELAKALKGLDVDWEEQLARLLGDPFAHSLGQLARGAGQWRRRTANTLNADLKEYLEEEARLLPTRDELADFLAEVDTLRDDVERLEARVERLTRRRAPQPTPDPHPKGKGATKRSKGPRAGKAP